MSLLSSDIFKITQFISLTIDKIKKLYKTQLELIEWNSNIDDSNLIILKNNIKNTYKTDNDFFNDFIVLSNKDETDLYRTILKIIDILDLNDSKLDTKLSKIFIGSPQFTNCGEDN